MVVTRREDCEAESRGQTHGSRDRGHDPIQRDAMPWQYRIFATNRRSRIQLVIARRLRAMVRVLGMGYAGGVRRRCDRDRLRNVIGVIVKGDRKGFATRENCTVKPEYDPGQHHRPARRPTLTQRQPGLRYAADTARR